MYFNMDVKLRNRTEFQNSVLHNHRKEKEPKENIDYERTKTIIIFLVQIMKMKFYLNN